MTSITLRCAVVDESDFNEGGFRLCDLKTAPTEIEQDFDLIIYKDKVLKNRSGPCGFIRPNAN